MTQAVNTPSLRNGLTAIGAPLTESTQDMVSLTPTQVQQLNEKGFKTVPAGENTVRILESLNG